MFEDDWSDEEWSQLGLESFFRDWSEEEKEDEMEDTRVLKNAIGLVKTNLEAVEELVAYAQDVKSRLYKTHEVLSDLLIEVEDAKQIDPANCLHPEGSRVHTHANGAKTTTCRDCGILLAFELDH